MLYRWLCVAHLAGYLAVQVASAQSCVWAYRWALVNDTPVTTNLPWSAFASFGGNYFNVGVGTTTVPGCSAVVLTASGVSSGGCPGSFFATLNGVPPNSQLSDSLHVVYGDGSSCSGAYWWTNVPVGAGQYVTNVYDVPLFLKTKDGKTTVKFYAKPQVVFVPNR